MSNAPRPDIVVIHLWPAWFSCQRCNKETLHAEAWPYYQEFLHPDVENAGHGYVPVCGDCALWLRIHANELWRGPKEWGQAPADVPRET